MDHDNNDIPKMTQDKSGPRKAMSDIGSAGVGIAMGSLIMLILMMLGVGSLRITTTNGDVSSASRAGVRAAANTYSQVAGEKAATDVVFGVLADRGTSCPAPQVQATGSWAPGGLIEVTVTCQVDLSDVVLAGFPGTRTITHSSVEHIDTLRGEAS